MAGDRIATENGAELQPSVERARSNYERFLGFFKWGAIAVAILVLFVILIIS